MSLSDDPAHTIPAASHLRRSRRRWRIAAILALVIAVVALSGRFAATGGPGDHIARVAIDGIISTDGQRLDVLNRLAEDNSVRAVIVDINSPGGTTAGGEELYEAIGRLRAEKPVAAVIGELGASAAYMTAISADHIFARRLSIVGSIGVLMQHVNAAKLLDTIGIDLDAVKTGPLKAEPDYDEPLTGAPRESMQALVDNSYEWFVDVVAERRGLERARAEELADGRIVTGRMGVANGLIDAIGGEREAVDWFESEKDVAADLPVVTHYPLPENDLERVVRYLGSEALSALGLGAQGPMALDGLVSLWQADPSR